MICEGCFEAIKKDLVGVTNADNQKCTGVSRTTKGQFALGIDFYQIFISYDEPINRGKKKGEIAKKESQFLIKTKFCCKCGAENK